MRDPKIAIVYDRLNTYGGAERVLQALHDEFPAAPLFTSVCDRRKAKWLGDWKVYTSFLQSVPFARRHHQWFGWAMPLAFETLDLSNFQFVISVTSEAAKGVLTKPTQTHICYCLTPTRYLWSHTHEYEGDTLGWLKRSFFSGLREWDYVAGKRPDVMVPISNVVKQRIQKYYRRETYEVIYPPTSQTTDNRLQITESKKAYYLVVSRLVPYKRVDLAIEACITLGMPLKIVGVGSDESRLRALAGNSPLIEFVGFVTDSALDAYYASAKALICAQEEDFGIVSVEAQARGIPVVSLARSGMAETIIDGQTGILFESQTVESLCEALRKVDALEMDYDRVRLHVQKFSVEIFRKKIRDIVQSHS